MVESNPDDKCVNPNGLIEADRTSLRSRAWFDNPANPDMTALYLEKYLNCGPNFDELESNGQIVGTGQNGCDKSMRACRIISTMVNFSVSALSMKPVFKRCQGGCRLDSESIFRNTANYLRIADKHPVPRDSH